MNGLWSRPFEPWLQGMRPNSVVQITIVSSSRPRLFRSWIRAAAGLIHARGHRAVVAGDVFVRVPVAPREAVVGSAPDLHEPDPALQQPTGNQAIAAEIFGDRLVQAIERFGRRRFTRQVEHLGRAQLQPGGQLVAGDAGLQPRVAGTSRLRGLD